MWNIFVFNETITNGFIAMSLDFISLTSILSGIFVIISKNPIVSVLFLIGLFLSISCYLIALGLNFIGLSYLLVYVGAVSILFLFILMLINVRVSELLSDTSNSIPLAIMVILAFSYSVNKILPFNLNTLYKTYLYNIFSEGLGDASIIKQGVINNIKISSENVIYYVTSKNWDAFLSETNHITTIGNIMYTSYSIWLILTSIILLLAMVGAIIITIKQD